MEINGVKESRVEDTALEFFQLWQNGVYDELYTEEEFEEKTNMTDAMDYVMSEVPKEARFLGTERVREIVASVRKEYI